MMIEDVLDIMFYCSLYDDTQTSLSYKENSSLTNVSPHCVGWPPRTINNTTSTAVLTFAHSPIPSVARLTGAAVAPDHVEAQGILIAVVKSTQALIMF